MFVLGGFSTTMAPGNWAGSSDAIDLAGQPGADSTCPQTTDALDVVKHMLC